MTLPWKNAWIIGGSTGLGAEVARQLDSVGVRVIVSARSEKVLQGVAATGTAITPMPLDITDPEAVQQAVETVVSREQGLPDLILLNAAVYTPMGAGNFQANAIHTMMQVNYLGVVNCLDALLPFHQSGKAVMVAAVASPSGWRGLPGGVGYGPTKAALINLFEGLKPELDGSDFDLRLVNPGFIQTRLTDKNDFDMPQLMTPATAARKLIKGLTRSQFDTAFPYPFVGMLKLLRLLPYRLYFWLMKKGLK